jgi:hypothetical protein
LTSPKDDSCTTFAVTTVGWSRDPVLLVGLKKGDLVAVLKRIGLGAPAHTRAAPLMMQQ